MNKNGSDCVAKTFQEEVASWVVKNNIKQRHGDELLGILRKFPGLENLPRSTRGLIKFLSTLFISLTKPSGN